MEGNPRSDLAAGDGEAAHGRGCGCRWSGVEWSGVEWDEQRTAASEDGKLE